MIPVFLLISHTQLISCSLFLGNHLHILCLFQLLTVISTIDDLNYPEKTDTYYVVNAPYIFSACWKVCFIFISDETCKISYGNPKRCVFWQVVRPLLHQRTRNRVQVLPGSGRDELLAV